MASFQARNLVTSSTIYNSIVSAVYKTENWLSENRNRVLKMASSENSSSDDYYFSTSQEVNKKDSKVQVRLSEAEEDLVIRMYKLVGDRWPLIAGRIPGRSADEIKKYWLSRYSTTAFPK